MTETESKTDPWKVAKSTIRARIADYSVALLGHSSGSQQAKENAQTAIDVAIDAARAAEAAQHRQEIAALRDERDLALRSVDHWLDRLAAVAAERDRLKAALQGVMPFIATQAMACGGMKCREMWCESCFGEDEAREFAQAGADAMGEASAALTPQGQSTDGETR